MYTPGRFERTSGERSGVGVSVTHQHQYQHTHRHPHIAHIAHTTRNTEHARCHRQFCLPKFAHVRLSLDPRGSPKRNRWILHMFSFRTDREQHVPKSSNHSLYLINLLNSSSPGEYCGGNQPPDGSICLSTAEPKFYERFCKTFHNGVMFCCYLP